MKVLQQTPGILCFSGLKVGFMEWVRMEEIDQNWPEEGHQDKFDALTFFPGSSVLWLFGFANGRRI